MNNRLEEMKYVVDNSKYVSIDYKDLVKFTSNFDKPNYKHWFSDINLELSEHSKILLAFIIESLNFCFWQKPKYKVTYHNIEVKGSEALFYRIIDKVESNKDFLNIEYLHNLSFDEFKKIFESNLGELSLIDVRYKLFTYTINVIYNKKNKFYKELYEIKSDNELLDYIVNNFKYFNDSYEYKGKTIHFYKRATLLVNDLFYMSETIRNNIKNINHMLGCADYGIPRTLREYKVLKYNGELSSLVDNEKEIIAGSEMEVEIRANMLYALELMKNILKKNNIIINSVELDNIVWNMGRKKKNIFPCHHTTTIFY